MTALETAFDIAFIGHYTKDTIVTKAGTRIVNGGAYFYGASAARRMGLKTAAVTRLAIEDFSSFAPLADNGAMVRAISSEHSTCLKLEYPTDNPDDRRLSVTTVASPFEPADIASIQAGVWSVGASIRGEVSLDVLKAIKATGARIGLDARGRGPGVGEGGFLRGALHAEIPYREKRTGRYLPRFLPRGQDFHGAAGGDTLGSRAHQPEDGGRGPVLGFKVRRGKSFNRKILVHEVYSSVIGAAEPQKKHRSDANGRPEEILPE